MFDLIVAWSGMDQLFNYKRTKYHLRDDELKSLEKIQILLLEDIDIAVKQITDKMLSLRNCVSPERQKEEAAAKKSGSGHDDLYISRLQF